MNQIHNLPGEMDAGLDFDYAAWSPNSTIRLCNVPWDSEYRNVVSFGTDADRNAYFAGLLQAETRLYNAASYVRTDRPIRLDIPFNRALQFNYVHVTNPAQPITGGDFSRQFFYFVLDVRYVSPQCTELVVQLDVWTTYINSVNIGNCFIERGHIGIANANAFRNHGREFLSVPEGLDIGSEYRIMQTNSKTLFENGAKYSVIAVSSQDLSLDPDGASDDQAIVRTARGSNLAGLPSGAAYYIWETISDFMNFMAKYSKYPWVTMGLLSITIIPSFERYGKTYPAKSEQYLGIDARNMGQRMRIEYDMAPNWRGSTDVAAWLPARYRHLKKFFTSPYMMLEMTSFTGQALPIKPEMWNSPDASVVEMFHPAMPNPRVTMYPEGYNANKEVNGTDITVGESLDYAIHISNFPNVPIVNDQAVNYLASTANSREYAASAAEWSRDKAIRSSNLSYDQANASTRLSGDLTGVGIGLDAATTGLGNRTAAAQAIWGGAAGVAAGLAGGPISAGMAAAQAGAQGVSTAMQIGANDEALALRTGATRRTQDLQTSNANYVADSNKALQQWSSRGDYESTIAGQLAKTQDAMVTQPSISGQMGGDGMLINFDMMGTHLRFKLLNEGAMAQIGEHWLRWGYAVQRYARSIPSDFHCMSRFTYWKLAETYITDGKLPEVMKRTIRGMFEKGVTVWRHPEDIGNVDIADNQPLGGIAL